VGCRIPTIQYQIVSSVVSMGFLLPCRRQDGYRPGTCCRKVSPEWFVTSHFLAHGACAHSAGVISTDKTGCYHQCDLLPLNSKQIHNLHNLQAYYNIAKLILGCRDVRYLPPSDALPLHHDVRVYDPERRLVRAPPRSGMCRHATDRGESGFGKAGDRATATGHESSQWKTCS
jgi:hypothetical protein